ncbi:MAG TPA: hypothetical protein VE687_02735 [Stellaceae bacterium]|nr:hypothetical protein [Stellaceae bacterium]
MMESQPIACTLAGRDLQDRLALIAALTRDALRGYERGDLTLKLRYAIEAAPRVQEMVRKERACCPFLSFAIYEQANEVWLAIKAPEEVEKNIDTLFGPFLPPSSSF